MSVSQLSFDDPPKRKRGGQPNTIHSVWRHVRISSYDGCWEWVGSKRKGYGRFRVNHRWVSGHRTTYELVVGPIPEGLQIDHLCRNRGCVNPAHLEPVTNQENQRRSPIAPAGRTHCPQNHPYDEQNTLLYRGGRYCRACHNSRRYRSKR